MSNLWAKRKRNPLHPRMLRHLVHCPPQTSCDIIINYCLTTGAIWSLILRNNLQSTPRLSADLAATAVGVCMIIQSETRNKKNGRRIRRPRLESRFALFSAVISVSSFLLMTSPRPYPPYLQQYNPWDYNQYHQERQYIVQHKQFEEIYASPSVYQTTPHLVHTTHQQQKPHQDHHHPHHHQHQQRRVPTMSLFKKGMIFSSFFGCCIAMALEAAAMATKYWVVSEARRRFDNGTLDFSSDGKINLGLFKGKKELNYGYGTRVSFINVTSLVVEEGEFMIWGLWIATLVCLTGALLFSALGAFFAVINTATNPINTLPGPVGLYVWNIAAMILNLFVILTWVAQFKAKLEDNVMDRSDRSHQWTSKDMATLGYSVWLIVGAVVVHLINVAAVIGATRTRKPKREYVSHASAPGKVQGAIMLY